MSEGWRLRPVMGSLAATLFTVGVNAGYTESCFEERLTTLRSQTRRQIFGSRYVFLTGIVVVGNDLYQNPWRNRHNF